VANGEHDPFGFQRQLDVELERLTPGLAVDPGLNGERVF